MTRIRKKFLTSERIVIFGFLFMILIGALLLLLPISANDDISFIDALFTATSSSCVTGLVVKDTASSFTLFGKTIILIMIQIGGMGVVTMATLISTISGKRIGLGSRNVIKSSISANQIGGIVAFIGYIVKTTIIIELLGALALSIDFCPKYGIIKGIGYGVFHSISAFCNAGFDIIGNKQPFSSLCGFVDNPLVNITLMFLIIIGGIGFLTWEDIKKNKFSFKKYRLQTKVILIVTALFVILPAISFYFLEFSNLPVSKRIFASVFQSVTLRTAGFNTVDFADISDGGRFMMIFFMLIGGAPGSTAGGMKITTVAVLFASVISVFKKKNSASLFNRRISEKVIKNAAAIFMLYLTLFIIGGIIISRIEGLPIDDCLFETASAIGTVGLTLGITPTLGIASKIVLISLMFLGRVGGLTFVYATLGAGDVDVEKLPIENINVG